MVYWFMQPILKYVYRTEVEVHPEVAAIKAPIILVADHHTYVDPLFLGALMPYPLYKKFGPFRGVAHERYFRSHFLRALMYTIGALPARQTGASIEELLEPSLKRLRAGRSIIIFPEGKRVMDGIPVRAKPGCIYIARASGCPIVPVRLFGLQSSDHRSRKLRREIKMVVLKPVHYPKQPSKLAVNRRLAQEVLDDIYKVRALS